jgi:hypothetical protein
MVPASGSLVKKSLAGVTLVARQGRRKAVPKPAHRDFLLPRQHGRSTSDCIIGLTTMANKREYDTEDGSSAKRVKMANGNGKLDAASNPYLAHWNDDSNGQRESSIVYVAWSIC